MKWLFFVFLAFGISSWKILNMEVVSISYEKINEYILEIKGSLFYNALKKYLEMFYFEEVKALN